MTDPRTLAIRAESSAVEASVDQERDGVFDAYEPARHLQAPTRHEVRG